MSLKKGTITISGLGTKGQDGAIQYSAGNNITIQNNTISTTIDIWVGTQTEYDNLPSYSNTTLYFVKEDTNAS